MIKIGAGATLSTKSGESRVYTLVGGGSGAEAIKEASRLLERNEPQVMFKDSDKYHGTVTHRCASDNFRLDSGHGMACFMAEAIDTVMRFQARDGAFWQVTLVDGLWIIEVSGCNGWDVVGYHEALEEMSNA
jgi:hypothetical protein